MGGGGGGTGVTRRPRAAIRDWKTSKSVASESTRSKEEPSINDREKDATRSSRISSGSAGSRPCRKDTNRRTTRDDETSGGVREQM